MNPNNAVILNEVKDPVKFHSDSVSLSIHTASYYAAASSIPLSPLKVHGILRFAQDDSVGGCRHYSTTPTPAALALALALQ